MPTDPLSPYALQKVVGEQYLQMFTQRSTASRPSRRATSTCSVRGRILRRRTPASSRCSRPRCSTSRAPTIYGDGEQTRDFTYVADVVDGVLRACEAPGVSGEIINVAAGGRISLNRLFETMRTLVGAQVSSRSTRRRGRATCATRRPTSPRHGASRLRAEGLTGGRPAADRRLVPHAPRWPPRRRLGQQPCSTRASRKGTASCQHVHELVELTLRF